jgi:4'-phosphopantetheinyl transferase
MLQYMKNRQMSASLLLTCSYTSHLGAERMRTALEVLSPGERARCSRLVFERDRRDFAIAHAMLRRSLSRWNQTNIVPEAWSFTQGEQGKPVLSDELRAKTRLHFNLTHTHGLVACAVARDRELGIDVESAKKHVDLMDIAARYFSSLEVDHLRSCDDNMRHVRFTEIWTLKEAYVKAIGAGLSMPLKNFAFLFDSETGLRFDPPPNDTSEAWRFLLFGSLDDYRLALALEWRQARDGTLMVSLEDFDFAPAGPLPTLLRTSHPHNVGV